MAEEYFSRLRRAEIGIHHHIAGAYLPADIFARYHRLRGNRVLMVSGSDAHGTPVTVGRLQAVERAESGLRAIGVVGNLRVRHHGETARVELDRDQLDRWLTPANRVALEEAVRQAGYASVIVDPAGYRTGGADAPLSRA